MTITTTHFRRLEANARAEEAAERERKDREANEDRRYAAEAAAAERERTLNRINLAPYDAAVWQALDNLKAAAAEISAASQQREQKASAVQTITPYAEQSSRIRLGPVPTLDGYRLTSNRKEEITEICRIISPVLKSIGGPVEHLTTNAVENRGHRGGNRLPRGNQ